MLRLLILVTAASASAASAQITNYITSAGYSFPDTTPVAPGQVISFFVGGLNVPNAVASTVPWPTKLSGVSVVVPNPPNPGYPTTLPILSVTSYPVSCSGGLFQFCNTTDIVVQFPYEPICIPNGEPNACTIGEVNTVFLAVQVNGVNGQGLWFSNRGGPHFLNSCDSIYGIGGPSCYQLITHADGSPVGYSGLYGASPAHPGEAITIYAAGLGPTPNAKTGQVVSTPDSLGYDVYFTPAILVGTTLQFGPPIKADWAGLVASFVGLYQINLQLPATIPSTIQPCNGAEGGNIRLFFGNQVGQDTLNATPFTDVCAATR
jgi:uncharacterized protein (TIGR03437 family)